MARALISPDQAVYTVSAVGETRYKLNLTTGQTQEYQYYPKILIPNSARVVEVVATITEEFEVAAPLFWVNCANTTEADRYYYDTVTDTIKLIEPLP